MLRLTEEETRDLLMKRIEETLRESDVVLPAATRAQMAALLPVDGRQGTRKPVVKADGGAKGDKPDPPAPPSGDNRTRFYQPTARAKKIDAPKSTVEKTANYIIDSQGCTLVDLEKMIKKSKKALYTALWALKKDGLITIKPLSSVRPSK